MSNIIKLPSVRRLSEPFPRQRVFNIGYSYFDPFLCQEDQLLCQEDQQLYLKRRGPKGERWWQLIIYDKDNCKDKRKYSIAIESCRDDELPDMLHDWGFDIIFQDLRNIGWEGNHHECKAKIIKLDHLVNKISKQ